MGTVERSSAILRQAIEDGRLGAALGTAICTKTHREWLTVVAHRFVMRLIESHLLCRRYCGKCRYDNHRCSNKDFHCSRQVFLALQTREMFDELRRNSLKVPADEVRLAGNAEWGIAGP
jgi:hypothetical protein